MATYHCSVKIISRSAGRSSVAAAAYRSGDTITNERDGITHDYSRKQGIEHSEIILPADAPTEFEERKNLWNAVEESEKRKDAQTAREIEIALPAELNTQEQAALVRDYAQRNFVDKGMCVDFSIHDTGEGNPHAHVMLTTRSITPEGFTKKDRSWNDRQLVESWREDWAKSYNQAMEKKNLPERVDHRSLQAQGIDREPTVHLGKAARMEKRGIRTERGEINRERRSEAQQLAAIEKEIQTLAAEREQLAAEPQPVQGSSPEQAAANLAEKLQQYNNISGQLATERGKLNVIGQQIQQQEGQRHSITQDFREVLAIGKKSDTLKEKKTEIQSKGIFRDRNAEKAIDNQLQSVGRSLEQAQTGFRSTWGIAPQREQVAKKVQEIETKIEALRASAAEPAQNISQLQEQSKAAELDYKTEKVLAEIRPDRAQVETAWSKIRQTVTRPPTSPGYSAQESITDRLQRVKGIQQIDKISPADYKAIAEKLQHQPELAAKVMQHSQQGQERQRREIDRGR